MIAFTNHALDHLLSGVLDAGITTKIVRLGSRSSDERISQFSIENLEMAADRSRLRGSVGANRHQLKKIQEELVSLVKSFANRLISSSDIMAYIEIQYPEHYECLCNPSPWIDTIISFRNNSDENEGWQTARKRGSNMPLDDTTYGRWLRGEDLEFLSTRPDLPTVKPTADETTSEITNRFNVLSIDASDDNVASDDLDSGSDDGESDKESETDSDSENAADWQRLEFSSPVVEKVLARPASSQPEPYSSGSEEIYVTPEEFWTPDEAETQLPDPQDPLAFFNAHSMDSIPEIPVTDRDLEALLVQGSMWTLSQGERWKLDQYWRERTRQDKLEGQLEEFERLRRKHKALQELVNEGRDEVSCVSI